MNEPMKNKKILISDSIQIHFSFTLLDKARIDFKWHRKGLMVTSVAARRGTIIAHSEVTVVVNNSKTKR